MTNSIRDSAQAKCFFVIGSNPLENHPIIGMHILRAIAHGAKLIVCDPRETELLRYSTVYLRPHCGTNVALLNGMMNIILARGLHDSKFVSERTEGFDKFKRLVEGYTPASVEKTTGVPAAEIEKAATLFASSGASMTFFAMGITQFTTGVDGVLSVANLAMLTGNIGREGTGVNPLRGQNNVQGSCDMGCLPNLLPGYQRIDDQAAREKFEKAWGAKLDPKPGLTLVEMMHAAARGDIKGLYIMGENPALSDPDSQHVCEALKKLDFLVVQDIFMTETARFAHVVLPAACFAEKDGTVTNTERRVQLMRQVVQAPGTAWPDWRILAEVMSRMGVKENYSSTAEVMKEISGLVPSYAGITHERLDKNGIQWPCPTLDHPGTPILHREKFTRGRGKFHAIAFMPPAELPDKEFPLVLTTGRILQHYHTGTMTRRSPGLNLMVKGPYAEINPADAETAGVKAGEVLSVASRRGKICVEARVTKRVPPGTLFIPFHFCEGAANVLTNAALDPVSKIPEYKVCAVRIEKGPAS
jgi:formate dehydrogenase alpha subunit